MRKFLRVKVELFTSNSVRPSKPNHQIKIMKASRLASFAAIIACTALALAMGCSTPKTKPSATPAAKGGQRLVEMWRPSSTQKQQEQRALNVQPPPSKPDPQVESPLTTSTNSGWPIYLSNADPDTRTLFEAFLRDMLNNVIGVDRLRTPTESDTEASFFVRCVFPNFETFKTAFQASLKSASENGLLTSTEVIPPGKLGFTNCTVETAKDRLNAGLEVRVAAKEPLRPLPIASTNSSAFPPVREKATNVARTAMLAERIVPTSASGSSQSTVAKIGAANLLLVISILAAFLGSLLFAGWGVFRLSKLGLRYMRRLL